MLDDKAGQGDVAAARDVAILRLLAACAMRRAEVVGLRLDDVQLDRDGGPIVMAKRKGNRERVPVLVSTNTAESLRRWLAARPEGGPWLFARLDRADDSLPLGGESVRRMLAVRAREAGVRGPVRPHGCRHAAAGAVARRGSLAELRAIGGWRSLSAVEHYLDDRQQEREAALRITDL
jgi:integrase/recombinase XerC